jgi:hypothetical protein
MIIQPLVLNVFAGWTLVVISPLQFIVMCTLYVLIKAPKTVSKAIKLHSEKHNKLKITLKTIMTASEQIMTVEGRKEDDNTTSCSWAKDVLR